MPIYRLIPVLFLIASLFLTNTRLAESAQCSYFNETFTGAPSNTWSNYNATWLIKNGKLNASAITSGKAAQAITAFSPAAYFTVDVDTEAVSLAQTNGSYGLYAYTTGTTYLSVNGKSLDGIAVFIYPNSTAQITAWDITNNAWYGSDTLTLSSAPTSIGLEFSSTGVTARINKQSTSLKFSAPINTPSIFNKIMLMASGSGFLFTGGTEVNFDNVCADPLVNAVAQFTLTTTKSGTGSGTVASSPPGISCGNDCSEKYNSGTQVTLTATANSGSTFSGWSGGGCSGTGTCSVTLTADTTVTAGFATSGGSTGGSCTATLDQSLKLNIPIIKYTDPVLGSIYLWTDMTYTANPSKISFKLSDYGIIPSVSGYTCTMSTLDSDLTIHVADLSYGGASYWLKLTYDTSLSSGSNLYFYAADYGTGTGGSTTPTTSTIYDSLPGTWTEAYSLGQTTCVGSTADTTYESVVTNSTNEVSGVKHVIKTNNANGTTTDYTVTDADSPFKMQSVPKAASNGSCTWTYTISFELTSSSAGQLSGTCTNSITNLSAGCTYRDNCTYTQHIEMTKKTSSGDGTTPTTDPILAKTEMLKGKWQFVYTIISTFTDDYTLTTIDGTKNSQGGYNISGTDKYGRSVVATYWPTDENWTLTDPGTIIVKRFTFKTDGSSILSGCYSYADIGSESFSTACYALSGSKTSTSTTASPVK